VERVLEETDAFQKGLQAGDRIVYANDTRILTALDLRAEIQRFRAGDMLRLTIERDGRELTLEIRLMDADLLEF
jgi:S1-C subfamily serine protease